MSNFWRSLGLSLLNCETELDLPCSKNCAISEISKTTAVSRDNPADAAFITGAICQINNSKLYVPEVTLSINDIIKLLENIKHGFKRTISWNKYSPEIMTQPKNNNLDYLIDPTFINVNRLFVFSFKMVMTMLQEILLMSITCH